MYKTFGGVDWTSNDRGAARPAGSCRDICSDQQRRCQSTHGHDSSIRPEPFKRAGLSGPVQYIVRRFEQRFDHCISADPGFPKTAQEDVVGRAGNAPHVPAQNDSVVVDPPDRRGQFFESGRNGIPPSVTEKDSEPCETSHLNDLTVTPRRCLGLTDQPGTDSDTHDELRKDNQGVDRLFQEKFHEQQYQCVAVSVIIAGSDQQVILRVYLPRRVFQSVADHAFC
jgi:hypothetical protein